MANIVVEVPKKHTAGEDKLSSFLIKNVGLFLQNLYQQFVPCSFYPILFLNCGNKQDYSGNIQWPRQL